ncbi:serine/threonine-protein kinase [Haliangium sp.]|uniref:serine/threonine-protein kinase n=1 Tax=Haliangium sp. TaxID=2663208 RepID=UPI003D0BBD8B
MKDDRSSNSRHSADSDEVSHAPQGDPVVEADGADAGASQVSEAETTGAEASPPEADAEAAAASDAEKADVATSNTAEQVPERSEVDKVGVGGADPVGDWYVEDDVRDDRLQERMFGVSSKPRRIKHYRLDGILGKGAWGTVFLAHDEELGRKVALKLLRPQYRELQRDRFLREAQGMAKLSSRYVVDVYERGEDGDEIYLAMKFFPTNLASWLEAENPTLDERLDAYEQAARGLADLHRATPVLVHRDVKPTNILVDPGNAHGTETRVVIADLGLISAAGPADASEDAPPTDAVESALDLKLTETGTLVGTIEYMAPEQLRAEGATPKSDQFSLCVSLYEALYGTLPFGGLTNDARLRAIKDGELKAPTSSLRVPQRVARVLRRGLAHRPEDRFADMNAFLSALRRSRRPRWPWLAGALALVVAAGGLIAFALSGERQISCDAQAAADLAEVRGAEHDTVLENRIEQATSELTRDAWANLKAARDQAITSWREDTIEMCEQQRQGPPAGVHADVAAFNRWRRTNCLHQNLHEIARYGRIWLSSGFDDPAPEPIYQLAADLRDLRVCSAIPNEPVDIDTALPDDLAQARTDEYLGDYESAVETARRIYDGASRRTRAEAAYQLGHTLAIYKQTGDAETYLVEAAEIATELHLDHLAAKAWVYLAKYAAEIKADPVNADKWERAARNALLRTGELPAGPPTRLLADYHEAQGLRAYHETRYRDAVDDYKMALAIRDQIGRDKIPLEVSKTLNNLSNALDGLGEADEATKQFQEALDLRVGALGPDHKLVGTVWLNLGIQAAAQKDYEQARRYLNRALDIHRRANDDGAGTNDILHGLLALGEFELSAFEAARGGHDSETAPLRERVTQIIAEIQALHQQLEDAGSQDARSLSRINEYNLIASSYQSLREDEAALEAALQGVRLYEESDIPKACSGTVISYAGSLANAGISLCRLDDIEASCEHNRRALAALSQCGMHEEEGFFRDELSKALPSSCLSSPSPPCPATP